MFDMANENGDEGLDYKEAHKLNDYYKTDITKRIPNRDLSPNWKLIFEDEDFNKDGFRDINENINAMVRASYPYEAILDTNERMKKIGGIEGRLNFDQFIELIMTYE